MFWTQIAVQHFHLVRSVLFVAGGTMQYEALSIGAFGSSHGRTWKVCSGCWSLRIRSDTPGSLQSVARVFTWQMLSEGITPSSNYRWPRDNQTCDKAICTFVLAFLFLPPSTFLVGFYFCKKVQGWKKASGLQGWMSSSFRNIADHGSKLGTKTPCWNWCQKQERFGWALMEYVINSMFLVDIAVSKSLEVMLHAKRQSVTVPKHLRCHRGSSHSLCRHQRYTRCQLTDIFWMTSNYQPCGYFLCIHFTD